MLRRNPKKKAHSIINKIEEGKATEVDINSLGEILDKEPSLVPEIADSLVSILKKIDAISIKPALSGLNIVADKDMKIISGYINEFASCLKKNIPPDEILKVHGIILKIFYEYPDNMKPVVPGLLVGLSNMNLSVRENAYSLLSSIAISHPEFFKSHAKDLERSLNGLNVDERIYSCKLITKIADKYPKILEDTYDTLSYLETNHPSRELRLEAAYAMAKLKIKEEVEPPVRKNEIGPEDDDSGGHLSGKHGGKQEIPEFSGVLETGKKEAQNVPGHDYIIKRKENINISDQIVKVISGTDISSTVLESVFNIAVEIAREGREGKPVGTSFIIGFSKDVLAKSKQLIHNPVEGIPTNERMITYPDFSNNIKELAQLDGAFVVSGTGVVEAACRFLIADASMVNIPKGFGTKHFSVAAMTKATKAIGLVVSESGGRITIFKNGKIVASFS